IRRKSAFRSLEQLANFTLTRTMSSERHHSVYFYHIPKFLKNSPAQRPEINARHQIFISVLSSDSSRNGGAKRDRTADLLRAKQALSQLSYGPIYRSAIFHDNWWVLVDSNCIPHPYQGCALTN